MPEDKISQLADALDARLLEYVRDGVPIIGADGLPKRNVHGEVLRRPCTPAMIQAARTRLKDLGVSRMIEEGGDIDNLADEMGLDVPGTLKLPAISEEEDIAARRIG